MSSPGGVKVTGASCLLSGAAGANGREGSSASFRPYDLPCGARGAMAGFWATRAALIEFTGFAAGLARYMATQVRSRP